MLTDTYSSLTAVNSLHTSLLEETLSWFNRMEFTQLLPLLQNWTKMKGMNRSTWNMCTFFIKCVKRELRVLHFYYQKKKYKHIAQIIYQTNKLEARNEQHFMNEEFSAEYT